MKKSTIINLLVFIGVLFYNFLFWNEMLGLNVLIFTIAMIAAILYVQPEGLQSRGSKATIAGTLIAAALVTLHHSWASMAIFFISFTLMAGFIQHKELRHIWYAFASAIFSFIEVPINFSKQFNGNPFLVSRSFRWLRLSVFPMLILPVFFVIYYYANSHFANFTDGYLRSFFNFFQDVSIEWFCFIFIGFIIIGSLLWKTTIKIKAQQDAAQSETLVRFRKTLIDPTFSVNMISLKDEYRIGLMALISLNALLFIVNIIDFKYVWFDSSPVGAAEMASFVHQGTYLLILSILLAMGVLLYYFRRNLNFFPKNKFIKNLAYVWIAQNAILATSLLMRNHQYVDHFGLAYKRIGVFVFLGLVFFGLLTMYFKVKNKKSLYFLLHRNAWALYAALMICACINWDVFITRYNINADLKGNSYDHSFLLNEVSDKNYFVLNEYKDKLAERTSADQIKYALKHKAQRIKHRQETYSWLSWNYSDYRNWKVMEGEKLKMGN